MDPGLPNQLIAASAQARQSSDIGVTTMLLTQEFYGHGSPGSTSSTSNQV
jgi:hypothetical protein